VFDLTPQEIVNELDRYIVGQADAKRSLAVALRERERRKKLSPSARADVASKNIMVIGPTGVGKTELARRLANLVDAPFLKTEATKFTEVGYVGRDVESIVRELADASVSMVHHEQIHQVREEAERLATDRILNYLVESGLQGEAEARPAAAQRAYMKRRRRAMARQLADHELEERVIEIEVEGEEMYGSVLEFASGIGPDDMHEQFQEFMNNVNFSRKRSRRVSVREARRILVEQEANKLVDLEEVVETALHRVEESGIVFMDEIDKLVTRNGDYGADVSGEGVQRDLLPIVEGASVATRYGMVNTEHILFVAAGGQQPAGEGLHARGCGPLPGADRDRLLRRSRWAGSAPSRTSPPPRSISPAPRRVTSPARRSMSTAAWRWFEAVAVVADKARPGTFTPAGFVLCEPPLRRDHGSWGIPSETALGRHDRSESSPAPAHQR